MVHISLFFFVAATTLCCTEATAEWISRPRSQLFVNAGETAKIKWKFPVGAKAITYEKKTEILGKGVRIAYRFEADPEAVIVDGYQGKVKIEKSGTLSILKPELKDEGFYCITITYTSNTLQDEVKIIIQEVPVITTFPTHSKSDVFYVGMTMNLLCMAKGRPVPEVQWFKDGVGQPLQKARGSILHQIKTASKEDSGRYTCLASNNAGRARRSIDYVILRRPYHVEFFHNTALDGTIYEGQRVVFSCSAKGNPGIDNYKLLHNGRELIKVSDGVYEIKEVRLENNGTYCCIPMNKAGLGENKTVNLRVKARPSYWEEKRKRTTPPSTTEEVMVTTILQETTEEQTTETVTTPSKGVGPQGRGAANISKENIILLSLLFLLSEVIRQMM